MDKKIIIFTVCFAAFTIILFFVLHKKETTKSNTTCSCSPSCLNGICPNGQLCKNGVCQSLPPPPPPPPPPPKSCLFCDSAPQILIGSPLPNQNPFQNLQGAQNACASNGNCSGITYVGDQGYTLRSGKPQEQDGAMSWVKYCGIIPSCSPSCPNGICPNGKLCKNGICQSLPPPPPPPPPPPKCSFSQPTYGQLGKSLSEQHSNLSDAQTACINNANCSGITYTEQTGFGLRSGTNLDTNNGGLSWIKQC